jgi:alcohol dehydrogenase
MDTPDNITINTAIDALSHLVEGYISTNSNILSDSSAEKGISLFYECMDALKTRDFTFETREKLLLISTLGGITIAQSGTSLPHGMGYPLTYYNNIPHGKANGLLLKSYLEFCGNNPKVKMILSLMELSTLDELGQFLKQLFCKDYTISEDEIQRYTKSMINNTAKLKNHPDEVTEKDIYEMYITSLL